MKINYINSACQEIIHNGYTLLIDPWLRDGIFDGSWGMAYLPGKLTHELEPDAIWFSHGYENYYDPLSIRMIRPPEACRFFVDSSFEELLKNDGFKPDALPTERWVEIAPGLEIALIAEGALDSFCLIRSSDGVVAFLANTALTPALTSKIFRLTDRIDLAYSAFTGVGAWPQCYFDLNDDEFELCAVEAEKKRDKFLAIAAQNWRLLKSPPLVLYDGEYTLIGKNAKLNGYRGNITREVAAKMLREQHGVKGILDVHAGGTVELIAKKTIIRQSGHTHYITAVREDRAYPHELQFNSSLFGRFPIIKTIEACANRMWSNYVIENTKELDDWSVVLRIRSQGMYRISFKDGLVQQVTSPGDGKYLLIETSLSCFLAAALSITSWESLEIGSHIKFKRIPGNYIKQMHKMLGHLYV